MHISKPSQLVYGRGSFTSMHCVFQLKPSPALRQRSPTRLGIRLRDLGPTQLIQSWPLWPFCCLCTQTYFHKQALRTSYMTLQHSSYMTLQHSTKLLPCYTPSGKKKIYSNEKPQKCSCMSNICFLSKPERTY